MIKVHLVVDGNPLSVEDGNQVECRGDHLEEVVQVLKARGYSREEIDHLVKKSKALQTEKTVESSAPGPSLPMTRGIKRFCLMHLSGQTVLKGTKQCTGMKNATKDQKNDKGPKKLWKIFEIFWA